jgi:hypothetical protein
LRGLLDGERQARLLIRIHHRESSDRLEGNSLNFAR